MKKLDYKEEYENLQKKVAKIVADAGLDPKKDKFEVVQPYEDNNAIVIKAVENDKGKRKIKVDINDSTITLPKKNGVLNMFGY